MKAIHSVCQSEMFVSLLQAVMERVKNPLDYLREGPEEQEWATAGAKMNRGHDSGATGMTSGKPQALLDKYYSEGKISQGHLDDR